MHLYRNFNALIYLITLFWFISPSFSAAKPPKAGTITFARLNTSINSEQTDNKVEATIIDGRYKGTRLVGQLIAPKGKDQTSIVHFTSLIPSKSKKPT